MSIPRVRVISNPSRATEIIRLNRQAEAVFRSPYVRSNASRAIHPPKSSRGLSACRRLAIRRGLRRALSRPAVAARRRWKDTDDVRAAFDLLIESFEWVGALSETTLALLQPSPDSGDQPVAAPLPLRHGGNSQSLRRKADTTYTTPRGTTVSHHPKQKCQASAEVIQRAPGRTRTCDHKITSWSFLMVRVGYRKPLCHNAPRRYNAINDCR